MTVPYWLDPTPPDPQGGLETCDVAVVGGGVSGASAAYWLRRSGYKVVILEARELASGASGRDMGALFLGLATHYNRVVDLLGREEARLVWNFTRENHELLRREILAEPAAAERCGYERAGSLHLAGSAKEFLDLRAASRLLEEDGFSVELRTADEANRTFGGHAFHGALFNPLDGRANPARLVREIAARSGAAIKASCEVHRMDLDENRRVVLRTGAGAVRAEMAVLAAGAWLPQVHPFFADKVQAVRGQRLALETASPGILPCPVFAEHGDFCALQLPDGSLVAGGMRQQHKKAETGYADETTAEIQESLFTFVAEKFPALAEPRITHRWSSAMGFSRDFLPFVGALPWAPNVMFIGGMSGHDWGFAFHLAKVLSETILHGKHPGLFAADRLLEQD